MSMVKSYTDIHWLKKEWSGAVRKYDDETYLDLWNNWSTPRYLWLTNSLFWPICIIEKVKRNIAWVSEH